MIYYYIIVGLVGALVGGIIAILTGYHALDSWQWWVITAPIIFVLNVIISSIFRKLDMI